MDWRPDRVYFLTLPRCRGDNRTLAPGARSASPCQRPTRRASAAAISRFVRRASRCSRGRVRAARDSHRAADPLGQAQDTRVYDEYLQQVSTTGTDQLRYHAVSVIVPRSTIDKMVRKLALLS